MPESVHFLCKKSEEAIILYISNNQKSKIVQFNKGELLLNYILNFNNKTTKQINPINLVIIPSGILII